MAGPPAGHPGQPHAAAKPGGITPEIAAYIQARDEQTTFKAMKDAHMKALNKLDHYAQQARGE